MKNIIVAALALLLWCPPLPAETVTPAAANAERPSSRSTRGQPRANPEHDPGLSSEGVVRVDCNQDSQTALALTIYNNNLGLVKDTRTLSLKPGIQEVTFRDVASQINPVTVHIKSLNAPHQLAVREQNYEYDLLNAQKLLDKFVGKSVKLVDKNYYTGR